MSINIAPGERDPARFNQAIRQLAQGRDNACGIVTLAVSAGTTTVPAPNCSSRSKVFLTPVTAAAAAELASGNCYISSAAEGRFVISHTNSATAGRTFNWTTRG